MTAVELELDEADLDALDCVGLDDKSSESDDDRSPDGV